MHGAEGDRFFFVIKEGELTSGEEGLSGVGGVDVEVIRVATNMLPPNGQRK